MTPDEARRRREEIQTRLGEINTRRRAIHEAAGEEPLNDEQAREWGDLDTEQRTLDTEDRDLGDVILEAERRQQADNARRQWGRVQIGDHVTPFDGEDVTRLSAPAARDRALAAVDRPGDGRIPLRDEQRSRLELLLRTRNDNFDGNLLARRLLITEHPDYRSAFMKLVTQAQPVLTPEESRAVAAFNEFRAMSIGTDSAGGFGVPVIIDPTIILTAQGHPNPFFQLGRVETITNDEWKGVTSAGVTWQFRAEAASASDNSPSLAQPTVPAHRADGYIPFSFEVQGDYPGFEDEMRTLLAEGYSELLVDRFTVGTGVDQPTGIVTALTGTASEVDLATPATLAATDVNGLLAALPIRYRSPIARTAWMSSTDVNNAIQQLGSGNNESAFTVDFTAEGVLVLKGRQAVLNDYMDALADTAPTELLIVGDWRNYLIAQRMGMSVELVPHVFDTSGALGVPTGQRALFAWARVGADSINDAGFRLLSDDGVA